jgi:hypothetical protein
MSFDPQAVNPSTWENDNCRRNDNGYYGGQNGEFYGERALHIMMRRDKTLKSFKNNSH